MLVFVIGAPGSGKGTLCKKLCKDFGYSHLSLGDHLRNLLENRRETLEHCVIERIENSELLPTRDVIPILKAEMQERRQNGRKVVLLDGFPRDIKQVKTEEKWLQPDLVLFFDCPGDIAEQRYLTRSYAGRDSDPNIFKKRYQEFVELNKDVLGHYEQKGILITVDTSKDTETSYERLLKALRASKFDLCPDEELRMARQGRVPEKA